LPFIRIACIQPNHKQQKYLQDESFKKSLFHLEIFHVTRPQSSWICTLLLLVWFVQRKNLYSIRVNPCPSVVKLFCDIALKNFSFNFRA